MSTIGYENWAVDLADVGAIYPFQGLEVPMVIAGVAFWLWWHIIQSRRETAHMEKVMKMGDPEKIAKMLDRY
ncbi:MAG: hypothetical protein IME92_04250 [Proteobacteria bacterium]|nr:hypothetical protein [Pseudomonadota bacterium]